MCCPSTAIMPKWASLFKVRLSDGAVIWWSAKGRMANGALIRDYTFRTMSVVVSGDLVYEIGGTFYPTGPQRSFAVRDDMGPTYDSFYDSIAPDIEHQANFTHGILNSSGDHIWMPSPLMVHRVEANSGKCVFEKSIDSSFVANIGDGNTPYLKESNPERWVASAPSDGFVNWDNNSLMVRSYDNSGSSRGTLSGVRWFCDHDADHFICVRQATSPLVEKRLKINPAGSPTDTFPGLSVYIPDKLSSNGKNVSFTRNGTAFVLNEDFDVIVESGDPTFSMTGGGSNPYLTATGTDGIYLLFNKYSSYSDGKLLIRKLTDDGLAWSKTLNTVDVSNTFYYVTRVIERDDVVYLSGWWKDADSGKIMNLAALDAETGDVIWQRQLVKLTSESLGGATINSPGLHFTFKGEFLFLACNGTVKIG